MAEQYAQMEREALEAPQRVEKMLAANRAQTRSLGARLLRRRPSMIITCARGSSDHAAACFRFAMQSLLRVPAFDMSPSIASVYDVDLDLEGALFILVSQSGKSPDMIRAASWAKENGAITLALVNTTDSDLARACDEVIDIGAGPETSVAATKSFICSVAAGLQIACEAGDDAAALKAVDALPDVLGRAVELDWSPLLEALGHPEHAYVVGRGPSLGIAQEMALKLKETSVLHAEAFSAAEIMHGPLQLLTKPIPVLVLSQDDGSAASTQDLLTKLSGTRANVIVAKSGHTGKNALPVLESLHPLVAPLAALQSFYGVAGALARQRGHDPDQPSLLKKITETV